MFDALLAKCNWKWKPYPKRAKIQNYETLSLNRTVIGRTKISIKPLTLHAQSNRLRSTSEKDLLQQQSTIHGKLKECLVQVYNQSIQIDKCDVRPDTRKWHSHCIIVPHHEMLALSTCEKRIHRWYDAMHHAMLKKELNIESIWGTVDRIKLVKFEWARDRPTNHSFSLRQEWL